MDTENKIGMKTSDWVSSKIVTTKCDGRLSVYIDSTDLPWAKKLSHYKIHSVSKETYIHSLKIFIKLPANHG